MVNDAITVPLRIGAGATRFGLRVVGQAIALGLSATERLIEVALPRSDEATSSADGAEPAGFEDAAGSADAAQPAGFEDAAGPADGAEPAGTPEPPIAPVAATPPAAPEAPDAGTVPEPAHVSREARLVESFADPGAEEGAGAAVHVEEPWKGYGHMAANDVIARLTGTSREQLAAVALYERAHRGRRTVLAAAERELRRATAAAP